MHYMVLVRDRRGEPRWLAEYQLDGLVPEDTIAHMKCDVVDRELGLCGICESRGCRCHILVPTERAGAYGKFCPVLWHDVFRPTSWRVEDLV